MYTVCMSRQSAADEYRDTARLVAEAAQGVAGTVQRMHGAIARRPFRFFGRALPPAGELHDSITELVYTSVRAGITVGGALAETAAVVAGARQPKGALLDSPFGRTAAGVVCGAFGERPHSPPPDLSLRVDGNAIALDRESLVEAFPEPSGHLVVFLHGLIETERWWYHRGLDAAGRPRVDFGTRLTRDLACTPLYVRYHTGQHISVNGAEFAEFVRKVVDAWPTPVHRISLVGHSMGGLVARSAVHQAADANAPWLDRLTDVVCLGSPHTGAPLELGAHLLGWALGRFPESAPLKDLLELRSPGIKDLRYGYLHEAEWSDRDLDALLDRAERLPASLPDGVRQCFLTVTIGRDQRGLLARFLGDGLVTPTSSGDQTQRAERHWMGGLHHFHLLHHDEVYHRIAEWLRGPGCAREPTSDQG